MTEFGRVTTRGGDGGDTSLFGGERASKDDILFETLGDIDELSSFLGLAKAKAAREPTADDGVVDMLGSIQEVLMRVCSQVATPADSPLYDALRALTSQDVEQLEELEKRYLQDLNIEAGFVVPGSGELGAAVDISRAVCRRAERHVVAVIRKTHREDLSACLSYLNRLSDVLFIVARWIDRDSIGKR